MAANDVFPRGHTISGAGSSTGGVVIPGIAGVSHVVTSVAVKIATAPAGPYESQVSVLDSQLGQIGALLLIAAASSSDTDSLDGELISSVGGSISVTWAALGSNGLYYKVTYHDI